jgi:hypothetical protein
MWTRGLTLCAAVALNALGTAPLRAQGASDGGATHAVSQPTKRIAVPTAGGSVKTGGTTATHSAPALTMQLRRDVTGDLSYRFITPQDESAAPAPLPAPTGSNNIVVLPVTVKAAGAALEVIDNTRGKVAHLPVATNGVAPLTDADFNMLLAVLVPVQSKGRAVVNATVTLTADESKPAATAPTAKAPKSVSAGVGHNYRSSWLLKPSDEGVATFANVPTGVPITVTVSSGSDTPVSQSLTLPTNPPADGYRWQTIEVPWSGVHTVALPAPPAPLAPVAGQTAPAATAPAPPAPQQGNSFLSGLADLLILGAVGYGLFWAYKQGHVKKMLDNLGIQMQPATAVNGPQGSPFDKPARAPIQPITEGTADPLAGGGGFVPGAVAPPVPGAGPRLVATMGTYAGNIFPLTGAATDIGRDAANPVPLPQDTNSSRRHATIHAANGGYTVTDNGSSNGTYINGVRINSQMPQPLRVGDELQIGMTRFRFEA